MRPPRTPGLHPVPKSRGMEGGCYPARRPFKLLGLPASFNVQDSTWQRLVPQSPKMSFFFFFFPFFFLFLRRPSSTGERQRTAAPRSPALHPLTSSPPPAGRQPPGREPLGRLSAPGSRGDSGRRRARRGGRWGGSSQPRRPLTCKVTAAQEEEEEGEKEGRKAPRCPCSCCRGRSSPRLSVSGGGCLVAFP